VLVLLLPLAVALPLVGSLVAVVGLDGIVVLSTPNSDVCASSNIVTS
jgi:hypothetical protein